MRPCKAIYVKKLHDGTSAPGQEGMVVVQGAQIVDVLPAEAERTLRLRLVLPEGVPEPAAAGSGGRPPGKISISPR